MVGYLGLTSPRGEAEMLGSFRKSLAESGFEEGRNVTFEFRFAEGDISRLPGLAAESSWHNGRRGRCKKDNVNGTSRVRYRR